MSCQYPTTTMALAREPSANDACPFESRCSHDDFVPGKTGPQKIPDVGGREPKSKRPVGGRFSERQQIALLKIRQ